MQIITKRCGSSRLFPLLNNRTFQRIPCSCIATFGVQNFGTGKFNDFLSKFLNTGTSLQISAQVPISEWTGRKSRQLPPNSSQRAARIVVFLARHTHFRGPAQLCVSITAFVRQHLHPGCWASQNQQSLKSDVPESQPAKWTNVCGIIGIIPPSSELGPWRFF